MHIDPMSGTQGMQGAFGSQGMQGANPLDSMNPLATGGPDGGPTPIPPTASATQAFNNNLGGNNAVATRSNEFNSPLTPQSTAVDPGNEVTQHWPIEFPTLSPSPNSNGSYNTNSANPNSSSSDIAPISSGSNSADSVNTNVPHSDGFDAPPQQVTHRGVGYDGHQPVFELDNGQKTADVSANQLTELWNEFENSDQYPKALTRMGGSPSFFNSDIFMNNQEKEAFLNYALDNHSSTSSGGASIPPSGNLPDNNGSGSIQPSSPQVSEFLGANLLNNEAATNHVEGAISTAEYWQGEGETPSLGAFHSMIADEQLPSHLDQDSFYKGNPGVQTAIENVYNHFFG